MGSEFHSDLLPFLRLGNRTAKRYSYDILGKRKLSVFHTLLANPKMITELLSIDNRKDQQKRAHSLGIPANRIDQLHKILEIPEHDKALCRAYITVSPELFKKHERMILRIAKELYSNWFGVKQWSDKENFKQQARIGFQLAVRGYTDGDIQFNTYAWHCVKRTMFRYISQQTGLSGSGTTQFFKFLKVRSQLHAAEQPTDFESVINEMRRLRKDDEPEITNDDAMSIKFSLNEERFVSNGTHEENTEGATSVHMMIARSVPDHRKNTMLPFDFMLALKEASGALDEWELECFKAHPLIRNMFDGKTLAQVARDFGKTAQAANYALERAQAKMAPILARRLGLTTAQMSQRLRA